MLSGNTGQKANHSARSLSATYSYLASQSIFTTTMILSVGENMKGLENDASASNFIPCLNIEGIMLKENEGIFAVSFASVVLILNYSFAIP